MSGVDKGDQLRQYYRVRMRCMKYYKYIFWFLFDVSITNSYILSLFTPTTMPISQQSLMAYRLKLADQLVSSYTSRERLGRPPITPAHPLPSLPPPVNCGHLPAETSCTTLHLPSHQKERSRCIYCSQYRNPPLRHDVAWYCKECIGIPSLCMTGKDDGSDCFQIWHTRYL